MRKLLIFFVIFSGHLFAQCGSGRGVCTPSSCAYNDVAAVISSGIGGTGGAGTAVAGDTVAIPSCSLQSVALQSMTRDATTNCSGGPCVTATLAAGPPSAYYFAGGTVDVVDSTGGTNTFNGIFTLVSVAGATLVWGQAGAAESADPNVGITIGCGTPNVAPSNCWSSMLNVTASLNFRGNDLAPAGLICDPLGLLGTATQVGCGSGGGGTTVIVDNVSKGNVGTCANAGGAFHLTPPTSAGLTISSLTVQGGARDIPGRCSWGHIRIDGSSQATRVTNITFNDMQTNALVTEANTIGVMDHSTCNGTTGFICASLMLSSYQNVGAFGDNSWAQPSTYGTATAFYFESNICNLQKTTGSDCVGNNPDGTRYVARFSLMTSAGGHGTDSGLRHRSMRHYEIYGNLFRDNINGTGNQNLVYFMYARGGSGIIYNNQASTTNSTAYNSSVTVHNYRDTNNTWTPYLGCDGANTTTWYDTTDGVLYFSGTATGGSQANSGSQSQMIDTTANFGATNSLVGFSIINLTGSGTNSPKAWSSVILSNTATTINSGAVSNGTATHLWNVGDSYAVRKAYPCIDQIGRGPGQLLSGSNPTICVSTGAVCPVNQSSEPLYAFLNTKVCTASCNNGGAIFVGDNANIEDFAHIQSGRDWCDDSGGGCVSSGILANRPANCTPSVTGYWATDANNPNFPALKGALYRCTATNTWTLYYQPFIYPHPLVFPPNTNRTVQGVTNLKGIVQF